MMYNKKFGCNDINILVNSNSKKVIEDLIDKYDNYYCDNTGDIDYIINYIVGEPTKEVKKYLDCERGDNSYNYITGNEKELTVYLPEYNSFKESFAKRIFTTAFVKMFQEKGYVILHGACAVKNNKGIVIAGDPGAGKTTLLVKLLKNGYSYVANDRIAIKERNNDIIVCGVPFSMGIMLEDAKEIIDNPKEKFSYIEEIDKVFIDTKDISKTFNVDVTNKAILHSIILCHYDLLLSDIKLEKLDNPLKEISSSLMLKSAIPRQKSYLHDIIGLGTNSPDFLNSVESWNLIQGQTNTEKIVEEIDDVVLSKRRKYGKN